MKAAVVEAAIPNMGLTFKSAQDARGELDTFYNLLNDFDPSMIGGKLPTTGYTMRGKAASGSAAPGRGPALGIWQLASLCFSPLVLPSVPQVTGTLAGLFREPDFWPTIGTTLLRLRLAWESGLRWARCWDCCSAVPQTGRCGDAVHPCAPVGYLRYAGSCWPWYGLGSMAGPVYSLWRHPPFQRW